MRPIILFAATILFALTGVPSPAWATPPIREVHPSQGDVVITDQCAFPVLGHVDGGETITTFTDAAGTPVKQFQSFPGNTLTLTNMDAGTSVTVLATGSTQVRAERDGLVSVQILGHGPFVPNPLTGEPGIWYLSGRGEATFDEEGNQLSAAVTGTLVDLCPRLAP
jgi:hypothetical protein